MSFKDKFLNFFKRGNGEEIQPQIPEEMMEATPTELEDPTIKTTWVGTEHIADFNLRWELKKIAKSENKTMREIVEELVKEYVDNYNAPKKTVKTVKCAFCGKEFEKVHNRQKYCSDECRLSVRRAYQRRYDANRRKEIKTPSKNKRKVSIETLPNGLKLKPSDCHLYSPLPWWGGNGNIYYGNGQKCPFSLTQLRDLKRRFDEIPKYPDGKRSKWIQEEYNIEIKSCDRMLWNLYKGTFDHIFEAYYQKNYKLQFDNNGKLTIGE